MVAAFQQSTHRASEKDFHYSRTPAEMAVLRAEKALD